MTSRQLEQILMRGHCLGALGIYYNYGSVRLGKKSLLSQLPANMNNYTWQKNYKKRV
jgi:hypothetical protein